MRLVKSLSRVLLPITLFAAILGIASDRMPRHVARNDREQGATIAGMSCTVTVSRRWFPKRKLGWRKLELTSGASPGKETSDGSERFRVRSARQLSSARRCVREGVLSCVKGSSTSVS